MKLTSNEVMMLANIARNEMNQGGEPTDPVWADSLDKGPHGEFIPRAGFGGIISSLVKKGLVCSWGSGRDAVVQLTDAGAEVVSGV